MAENIAENRRDAMRRDQALATLRAHLPEMAPFGVKSLALFGSVARDEARPDSDLDLLVEFDGLPRSTATLASSSTSKTCSAPA